jgi:lysozyme
MYRLIFIICASMTIALPSYGQDQSIPDELRSLNLQYLVSEPSRNDLFLRLVPPASPIEPIQDYNLWGSFKFPIDAIYDRLEGKNRDSSIFGIDISHHTISDIPLELMANFKVKFVYMKSSQGSNFIDGKFANFWRRLDDPKYRVHRGAYHFLSANVDPEKQAKLFVSILKSVGGLKDTDMPPVVDLEWDVACSSCPDRWSDKEPKQIISSLKIWLSNVESHLGRKPMIYTTNSWWKERIKSDSLFSELDGYPIWIADYSKSNRANENPRVPLNNKWQLWQFSDRAEFETGYERGVDANIFKGSAKQFYEIFSTKSFGG